jgi:hypothetical protein
VSQTATQVAPGTALSPWIIRAILESPGMAYRYDAETNTLYRAWPQHADGTLPYWQAITDPRQSKD